MTTSWTPGELLQLASGYWSVSALHAGVALDVFTPLGKKGQTAGELANSLGTDPRALEMLLNALSAMRLLNKQGDRFAAVPFAAEFLSQDSKKYLGHIISHHHHLMESWAHLDQAVLSGGPLRERSSHGDDEWRKSFLLGMFNLAMQIAPQIVPHIEIGNRRRLLDLGGGPGTYAIHFCMHNPGLKATVYDLPATREFAENTIARFDLLDRVEFAEGDYLNQGIEGRYDVAWLSHILHSEDPEGCLTILKKAVGSLDPGGLILIQEFILDDTMDGPLFPTLFSLNMLLGTPRGQAYSQEQISGMLAAAGVTDSYRLPLDLPNGAGVIIGTLPGNLPIDERQVA